MPTPSDERMAKLKAAINQCRDGDLHALSGLAITNAELTTISALAKATGDAYGATTSSINGQHRYKVAVQAPQDVCPVGVGVKNPTKGTPNDLRQETYRLRPA